MFNHRKYLFTQKKTSYKNLFFISIISCGLIGAYFFVHAYLKHEINDFLKEQQFILKKQNLILEFKYISTATWKLWPQITLSYPTLQKKISFSSQTIWQTKQATIYYSIWHPLSFTIKINGEQLYCPNSHLESCFQLHGDPWHIYVPLTGGYENNMISLKVNEIFYTKTLQSMWDIHSFKFKKLRIKLHWNSLAKTNDSFIFSELKAQQALINFATFSTQKINNIHLKVALIQKQNTKTQDNNLYKILLQKANLSWHELSIDSTGKFYLPYPSLLPTGEIYLHLAGIDQTIYQQLKALNCCTKLKEELSQTSLPSQLNFTLFIRDGVVYLGAIPLQTIWYDNFTKLVNIYTK